MSKKLNPKLDAAIADFGDAANVPGPAHLREEYWVAHAALLDVVRELMIEAMVSHRRRDFGWYQRRGWQDGLLSRQIGPSTDETADAILYPEGDDDE